MIQKICSFCGEPFEAKVPNQTYCKRQHYNICEICGTKYPIKDCREYPKTCSKKCGAIMRKQTCNSIYGGNAPASSSEIRKKIEQTNYVKYGAKAPMQNDAVKQKAVQTNLDKYGVEWTAQTESSREKRVQTNLERYGTANPMGNPEVHDKFLNTMRERYGVDYRMQSEDYRKKRSEEYQAKTGYVHHWANPEVQAKSRSTWAAKYGEDVNRPLQAKEVQERLKQTNIDKYGVDNPLKAKEIREKIRQTNLDRYGYENVASNPEIRAKMEETNRQRYGKPFYAQTNEARLAVMRNPERLSYLNEFQEDPIGMIDKYFPDHKPTLRELMEFTGVSEEPIYTVITKFNCQEKIAYVYSYMEREVQQALREIDPEVEITTNVHSIITPYELDIYLPQYKIAIECNPTATHNSSIYAFSHIDTNRQPTAYDYHKMKTELCDKQGIFLFHIFGYEWKYRREIIISMLRNLLGKNTNKVFARNTYVKEVTATESAEFLLSNHRQGNAQAPIKLGLYVKDTNELVSVMTFGKMRGSMGTSIKEDDSEIWELVRFCNKMNTSVIGGASKLFTAFIDKYNPKEIRSFSDRAHTKGTLYKTLGFTELRRSSPNYVWVDYKTEVAYHRINAQKRNLKKFLKDDSIDLNQTEREIMEAHGYVRVYDSGTITWQWYK